MPEQDKQVIHPASVLSYLQDAKREDIVKYLFLRDLQECVLAAQLAKTPLVWLSATAHFSSHKTSTHKAGLAY